MVSHKEVSVDAFHAIYQHLETLLRAYILDPTDFIAIRDALINARDQVEHLSVQRNLDNLKAFLNTAIDNNAPIRFFKKLSEVRMNGPLGVANIVQFTARIGLVYYFELLSSGSDFSDLQAFRERANNLKWQAEKIIDLIQQSKTVFELGTPIQKCRASSKSALIESQRKVIKKIDEMIYLLGQSSSMAETYHLAGCWNALVASYHLFGNVSQANEITALSFGVSGTMLNGINYYQDK